MCRPGPKRSVVALRINEVKSQRADLSIESQKGYFALPVLGPSSELAAFEMAGLAALSLPQPPHAFEFKADTYHFRPNVANSQNEVVFEIPAAILEATPEPGLNRRRMHVAVVALE